MTPAHICSPMVLSLSNARYQQVKEAMLLPPSHTRRDDSRNVEGCCLPCCARFTSLASFHKRQPIEQSGRLTDYFVQQASGWPAAREPHYSQLGRPPSRSKTAVRLLIYALAAG